MEHLSMETVRALAKIPGNRLSVEHATVVYSDSRDDGVACYLILRPSVEGAEAPVFVIPRGALENIDARKA